MAEVPHSLVNVHRHQCAYCGAIAQSRDHVPPKAWFAREVRTRIRVPSCHGCNHGRSKADEEFGVILSFLAGLKTPTQRKLAKKIRRTLDHSPNLRAKLASGILRDKATGQTVRDEKTGYAAMSVSRATVDDAMVRIVQGLHWHHYRERADFSVLPQVWKLERPAFEEMRSMLITDLRSDHVGHDQFEYMHGRPIEKPSVSLWLLAFYRNVFFAVVTGSTETELAA